MGFLPVPPASQNRVGGTLSSAPPRRCGKGGPCWERGRGAGWLIGESDESERRWKRVVRLREEKWKDLVRFGGPEMVVVNVVRGCKLSVFGLSCPAADVACDPLHI